MTGSDARVDADWTYRGLTALVLQNRRLRVVVLPELGGKIISLVHKPTDRELLWTHPRLTPRAVPFGSGYDDQFFGGWDELYPNDEAEVVAGESLPDHGEIWSLPWHWEIGADESSAWVRLSVQTPVTCSSVVRTLRLRRDRADLQADYALTNTGPTDQPYLWKSHVAVGIEPGSRLELGAGDVLLHEFGRPRGRPAGDHFRWPTMPADGIGHDMRVLPAPDSGLAEFLIPTGLVEGTCGVWHPATGIGLRLRFDPELLRSCWTFGSYGGWRGLNVLILEPCTGFPLSLTEGVAAGTHRVLPAGGTRTWSMGLEVRTEP